MSLTPSNSRMMSPAWGGPGGIKLTPSSPSPFKSTPLRSPIKNRAEASLALKQVIGTTTNSANAFDSLPSSSAFAFTAGAAAVLASVDDQHRVSQRFYRARPTANPINPSGSVYGGPSTPTQNESRNRTAATLREAGIGGSPLASPTVEWSDSPANKNWNVRDRIKAATCVSFSPNGRFLAVGETGYKPRVLIFSTSSDAPSDTPLTSLSDHTFGVRCLAFSQDSQYLASLGYSNDGFLYIWSINSRTGAATLHASNKCTSNINRMVWMGSSLVTVGTRHVKVWRVEDLNSTMRGPKSRQSESSFLSNGNIHKTLPGRNCLLESLLETNFTSVVAVAPTKAIVASDKGDICVIDDTDGGQRFSKVAEAGFAVTSMAVDLKGRLHLASSQGGLKTLSISDTIGVPTPPPSPPPRVESPTVNLTTDSTQIEAIGALADYLVTVDSHHSIRLSRLSANQDDSLVGDIVQQLPAHDSVLGVAALSKLNTPNAAFYTWSAGGSILFWNSEGICKDSIQVHLEQSGSSEADVNELKTVRASADASYVVTGDRYGVLRIIDSKTKTSAFDFKAHASEITGISIFEENDSAYIACAARDRTAQIFARKNGSWDIMQTLDEHVGAVTGVLFSKNGQRLVSCSSDRTLVVREFVSRKEEGEIISAFVILRTIILKTTPVSMAWDVDQEDVLLVSTIDRQVHKYDLRNGQAICTFRASDSEGGDAVVMSSLVHIPRPWGSPLIAGVSNTDKSIRLYEEGGTLLARDWGHTEGVTDIAFIHTQDAEDDDRGQKSLVTVAVDGTIFVWTMDLKPPHRQDLSKSVDLLAPSTPTNQDLLMNKPPLRRVFSQSELARFQRSPVDDNPTPTGNRSPKLRKKLSKFSLSQTPKLEPSPMPSMPRNLRSSGSSLAQGTVRRSYRHRSPSPPSPRSPQVTLSKRRSSVDVRVRTKPPANEFGSLGASTESLCRTLRAYRKRLANSTETMTSELVREAERELALTARAIGEKAKSKGTVDEQVMVKLLDQYSERLVTILDEKIAASVAQRLRENSESGMSGGLASPALEKEAEGEANKELDKAEEKARSTEYSMTTDMDSTTVNPATLHDDAEDQQERPHTNE